MIAFPHRLLRRTERCLTSAEEGSAGSAAPDAKILLDHIAEVSQNARATWFGLLGLLVFVGVTLLAHKDADFFAYGAETALPLIGITVPVKAFFYTAPVLVAALYIYLQLYLLNLWDALAEAPPQIDGQPLGDRVFPWLISHAALWYRNRRRDDDCASPRPMGRFVVWISVALGALFAPFVLFVMWVRSMPAHDEWLTLWIALWVFVASLVGITGMVGAARRMGGASRAAVSRAHGVRQGWGAVFALLLAFVSWDTTEGGLLAYRSVDDGGTETWQSFIPLYPANLREAVLTPRPNDWQPYDRWIKGFDKQYRAGRNLHPTDDLPPSELRAFWQEAKEEWSAAISGINAPQLRRADLRQANLRGAFLTGADLRGARLDGADLSEAQASGARLECWSADSGSGDRDCSSMQGAELRDAQMQGADLKAAQMQGAYLGRAKMQGADFTAAQMQGINLWDAEMQGTNLGKAEMQRAFLWGAQMQGANLSEAQMQRANLRDAEMQGADLRWANLEDAGCANATHRGALAQSAILKCRKLEPSQLTHTIGNSATQLPPGLTVVSCLESLSEDVREAINYHPEEVDFFRSSRTDVEKALLCGNDEAGNPIEPERVGRSAVAQE